MHLEQQVPLRDLTTLHLGGKSRFFVRAETLDELKEALHFATQKNLPFRILGEGSNILIPDEDFSGITIQIAFQGKKIIEAENDILVSVAAGENWDAFVAYTIEKKWYGLENLSGIPGTVGAAPIQNIGAYGVEVRDVIDEVEVLDAADLTTRILSKSECLFDYRDSIFKSPKNKNLIVVHVVFRLKEHGTINDTYRDVREYFERQNISPPTLSLMREAVLAIRGRKFPDMRSVGTAGSFFKNPTVEENEFKRLQAMYPAMPYFVMEDRRIKLPLAWILDHVCSLKGIRHGNVGTFEKQPLVLVHYGNGSTREVKEFASYIQEEVKRKTNLSIVPEVTYF